MIKELAKFASFTIAKPLVRDTMTNAVISPPMVTSLTANWESTVFVSGLIASIPSSITAKSPTELMRIRLRFGLNWNSEIGSLPFKSNNAHDPISNRVDYGHLTTGYRR